MKTPLAPAPAAPAVRFEAPLEASGPSFMPTQIVGVPPAALAGLGPAVKRVVATFNAGPAERLGLLPQAGGGRYLLLRKDLCRALDLKIGQLLAVTLRPDPAPDHIDLGGELERRSCSSGVRLSNSLLKPA